CPRSAGPASRGNTPLPYPRESPLPSWRPWSSLLRLRGLQGGDPPLHVPKARLALAEVLEEVERLPPIAEAFEDATQQVEELQRLRFTDLRHVKRLLVPGHGLAK